MMRQCCQHQCLGLLLSQLLVCWLGLLGMLVLCPGDSAAHTTLVQTLPAAGTVVAQPPRAIQFWFTEPIERTLSRIAVFRVVLDPITGDVTPGQRIDQGWLPGPRAAREVGVRLPEALPAGRYLVQWVVVAIDAHRLQGTFTFTYDPSSLCPLGILTLTSLRGGAKMRGADPDRKPLLYSTSRLHRGRLKYKYAWCLRRPLLAPPAGGAQAQDPHLRLRPPSSRPAVGSKARTRSRRCSNIL